MPNLDSDLAFGVCNILIYSSAWKNVSGAPGRSDGSRRGRDCAWKGEAPTVLFSNRTQLWLSLSPINISEC